jgi:hypothetical protein
MVCLGNICKSTVHKGDNNDDDDDNNNNNKGETLGMGPYSLTVIRL